MSKSSIIWILLGLSALAVGFALYEMGKSDQLLAMQNSGQSDKPVRDSNKNSFLESEERTPIGYKLPVKEN